MHKSCASLLVATALSSMIAMPVYATGDPKGISAQSSMTTKPFPKDNAQPVYGSGTTLADDGGRWFPTPEHIAKLPKPVRDREEKIVAVIMLPVELRRGPTLEASLPRSESETPAAFLPTLRQVEARAKPLLDREEPTIVSKVTLRLPRSEKLLTNP